MLYTTLALLRKQRACSGGMATLVASLPSKHNDDELIPLAHILKSNGLEHAIWALRATTVDARVITARMAIEFALSTVAVWENMFPEDKRPRATIQAAIDFLDGKITLEELLDARLAALDARVAAIQARASDSVKATAWRAAESARAAAAESAWRAAESAWGAADFPASEQHEIFLRFIGA